MIVCLVGFLEKVYNVQGEKIVSGNLLVVVFSLLVGGIIGEKLRLDEKLGNMSTTSNKSLNSFIDATLFFGVGGLQISGPILMVTESDSSQLILKAFIDLPFAIAFGSTYGKITSLSALPVAAMQIIIALIAYFFSGFFSDTITSQLCAMGYVSLFFSGYNLITNGRHRISNINMLPGIILVVLFNLIIFVTEKI